MITRLHILIHWSQLWLKWTFGQSNNIIGTIDIRGGLTVSRWLLTEQVWPRESRYRGSHLRKPRPREISLYESLGIAFFETLFLL